MITGKKGLEKRIVVGYAIGIVAGLIVIIGIVLPFADAAGNTLLQGALSDLCNFNAGLKHGISSNNPASGALKDNAPLPFCFDKRRTVDATAWKKCDPENYLGLKDNKNRQAARTKCAAIQIATLAKSCFDMYGSDRWNLKTYENGEYPCFSHIKIKHLGQEFITEPDFNRAMKALGPDQGFCGTTTATSQYFNNNDCWKTGACLEACGSSNINAANADNVIWAGDLFSEDYAKRYVKTLKDAEKDVTSIKSDVDALKSQLDALNLKDKKATDSFYNKLIAAYNRYKNPDYALKKEDAGYSFDYLVAGFKDKPALYNRKISDMLFIMSMELDDYLVRDIRPNIVLYSKGNLMCFDECGGETLAGVLGGLGCSEFGRASGKYGTDAVKINDVNKPKSLKDPLTGLFTVDYTEGCKI